MVEEYKTQNSNFMKISRKFRKIIEKLHKNQGLILGTV